MSSLPLTSLPIIHPYKQMAEDIFKALPPLPPGTGGYTRLAEHMGEHANRAVFRRFGQLNALNLLYLQAELVELEREWAGHAAADLKSPLREHQYRAVHLPTLRRHVPDGESCDQWRTMLKIREVLKEYSQWFFFPSYPFFAP